MKIVRFKGSFKDLIPNGWTFQKLFARNYRQYHKTCDGEEYSQGCRIWQHHGGYLEIDDLFNFSAILIQKIIDGNIEEWSSEITSVSTLKEKKVYWFIIDQEEGRFIPRGSEEYTQLRKKTYTDSFDPSHASYDEKTFHAYFDRYRQWNARPELIEMLKDLVNRGWISVEENEKSR